MPKKPTANDDGMMTLPECASYLHLSDNTVLKLATNNKLPGVLVDKKWQFKRELLDEWLQEQFGSWDDGIDEIPDGMRVPLGDLLLPDAMMDLSATDPVGIIEEMAARAYSQKWLFDKPWFVGAVIERESLASTAMEGGVAFLHTRSREANKLARPFIIVGRSYTGVDFGAPDGKPTFIFFMLGLKYDKLHLPILGRLARAMRNTVTINKLRAQPSPAKMRALLLREDAEAISSTRQVPVVQYAEVKPTLDRQMRLRTIMRLNALRKHEAKKAEAAEQKKTGSKKSKKSESAASAAQITKTGAGKAGAPAGSGSAAAENETQVSSLIRGVRKRSKS